ncbi:hypothetical protein ADT71_02160 [Novosphingobium sp. ST904]|nr:hypothetical protein ADT71_02160 [Novosphingobium sp. ST904]
MRISAPKRKHCRAPLSMSLRTRPVLQLHRSASCATDKGAGVLRLKEGRGVMLWVPFLLGVSHLCSRSSLLYGFPFCRQPQHFAESAVSFEPIGGMPALQVFRARNISAAPLHTSGLFLRLVCPARIISGDAHAPAPG